MHHRSAGAAIRWSRRGPRSCPRSPAEAASCILRHFLLPAVPFANAAVAAKVAKPKPATVPTVPSSAAAYARSTSSSTALSPEASCGFSTAASVQPPELHHCNAGGCSMARRAQSHPKTASRACSTRSMECDMIRFLPATRLKHEDVLLVGAHWRRNFSAKSEHPGESNAAKRRVADRHVRVESGPFAANTMKPTSNAPSRMKTDGKDNDPELEGFLDRWRHTGNIDPASFTTMLARIERRALWQLLDDLWQLVRADDPTHTVDNFNTMLQSYITRGTWKHFADLTERMEMENVQYNAETYRLALLACVKLENRRNLHFLWHKAVVEGVPLTTEHYNIMIQGCLEAGHMEMVEKLFRTMDEKAVPFSVSTYTWKMLFLVEIQRWNKLEELWTQLKASTIYRTTAHYNLMLRASQERRNLVRLYSIWDEMVAVRVWRDAESYGHVMKSCLETESWIKLIALWNEMDARGVRRDIHLYNLMFRACVKTSSYEQLDQLWQKMLEDGLQPDEFTYEEIKPRPAIELLPLKKTFVPLEDDASEKDFDRVLFTEKKPRLSKTF